MKKWMMSISMLSIPLVLWGCSTAYTLRVVDEGAQEIYLSYSKDTHVKIGDVFAVYYKVETSSSGTGGHSHGSSPYAEQALLGTVKISKVVDEKTARVNVISGTVQNGANVEFLRGEQQRGSQRPPGTNRY